jgi:basic membrane protein A and related proteins
VTGNKLRFTNHVSRINKYIFLTMIAWALSACLSSSDCFREEVICAALVTDTLGIDDHGINQDAWAGLQEAKANGLADQVEYIASVDSRDYLKNIAYFTERGFDVIFTSGIALDDKTLQSADLKPVTVFVGLNQPFEESRPNLISVTFPEDQMGFAAGASAARLTRTGIVAAVCETSGIDSMWRYCEGFRAGVKFADEKVKALIVYREDGDREKLFIDEAWGYETGSSLIGRGADVLFAAGGVTGQGALKAATEFGIYAIGAERDQAAFLGESGLGVVTSFYGQTSFEVQEVMRLLGNGEFGGERVGRIQFVGLNRAYPPNLSVELELLLAALAQGEIKPNLTEPR